MMNKNDSRLVNRQLFILEQTKSIIKMLEGDTKEIDWSLIANIGEEITATAKTAMSLDNQNKYKIR